MALFNDNMVNGKVSTGQKMSLVCQLLCKKEKKGHMCDAIARKKRNNFFD